MSPIGHDRFFIESDYQIQPPGIFINIPVPSGFFSTKINHSILYNTEYLLTLLIFNSITERKMALYHFRARTTDTILE